MDYEIKIEEGDYARNSVSATLITRLTEAEEQKWRGLLAAAWDEGHKVGRTHPVSGHWNPYRD